MEGPIHVIATTYCPLETTEEKLENQQNFCQNCINHDTCEEKAKACYLNLKEVYLKPYDDLLKFVKTFEKSNLKKIDDAVEKFSNIAGVFKNVQKRKD